MEHTRTPQLRVYNTLTRRKDEFIPMQEGKVKLFVCGPTVYDFPHLGHAKTYTQFDFIVRYLRHKNFEVFYLQNLTDIDDKIINRAKEQGISASDLAIKFENIYFEDMQALHNISVSEYARATKYIPDIVRQVQTLVEKGFAYRISDGYYFDLKKFSEYGKLSGRTTLQENDAVSRIDENDEKHNKGDFCLWKFEKPGEPMWDTALGKGRPGWHIEDTAITEHFFGSQYDLHGGAVDLIFPHHEAEIAQMEAASGKQPLVRYWVHTAFLNINSEKMAKSKGNFKTIRDALKLYNYRVLRYFFLSQHYRTPMDFSTDILEQAKNGLQRINDFIFSIDKNIDDETHASTIQHCTTAMHGSFDDDFDTPKALATLFDFIKEINTQGGAGKKVYAFMQELDTLFECMTFDFGSIDAEIKELIAKREEARQQKDWKRADELRTIINQKGYIIDDKKDGSYNIRKA